MRPIIERKWGRVTVALLMAVIPAVTQAQPAVQKAQSPQEEERRKLLQTMGLTEKGAVSTPARQSQPEAPGVARTSSGRSPEAADASPARKTDVPTKAVSSTPSFRKIIHPGLMQTCKACHTTGGAAGATPFVLSGDPTVDHKVTIRMLDLHAPETSLLLLKATGQQIHGGGALWPKDSVTYVRALAWIRAGARLDGTNLEAPATLRQERPPLPQPTPRVNHLTSPATTSPTRTSAATTTADPVATAVSAGTGASAVSGPAEAPAQTVPPDDATIALVAGADFAAQVHPLLVAHCASCHRPNAAAAATRFILSSDARADYPGLRLLVDPSLPETSLLIEKASGKAHAGGPLFPVRSEGHRLLVAWVRAGAIFEHVSGASAVATSEPLAPSPARSIAATASPPDQSNVSKERAVRTEGASNLTLPFGLAIDGRFDVAYERRRFSGNPFVSSATNSLRSYHHFLVLTRESVDDPVGIAVEMLGLLFWDVHYRWRANQLPIQVVIAAGKILVPFGAEPLMHQSYGGLSGFDQRILPVIWAQEGAAVHVLVHRRELALTDDFYMVRGYALHQSDGVINLQNDFSPDDASHLGFGNRLGGAWGPISAWYSTYYNPLGFDRRLFLQAGDIMLYRLRQVPILGHFSFAGGLLRADVSGGNSRGNGGPGKDYYHFGSYLQVRYHPTDWLYVQYRQGLSTFNNRQGVIVDNTRLTTDDGSAHNFGVVARWHGLTAGVYYFINLEKVAETPNDLLRVSLTYEF